MRRNLPLVVLSLVLAACSAAPTVGSAAGAEITAEVDPSVTPQNYFLCQCGAQFTCVSLPASDGDAPFAGQACAGGQTTSDVAACQAVVPNDADTCASVAENANAANPTQPPPG